jgi:hypothetical protein
VQRRDRLLTIRGKAPSQLHAKLQVSSTQSSKSAPRKAPSQLHAKLQVSSTQGFKSAPRKAPSQLHAKLQVSSTQGFKSARQHGRDERSGRTLPGGPDSNSESALDGARRSQCARSTLSRCHAPSSARHRFMHLWQSSVMQQLAAQWHTACSNGAK